MSWRKEIIRIITETTKNKSNHNFTMSSLYKKIDRNFLSKYKSKDWKATFRREVQLITTNSQSEGLIRREKRGLYSLNSSNQRELREIMAKIVRETGQTIRRDEVTYQIIENSEMLKPGDMLLRPSRNFEPWYRQNIGNALRDAKEWNKNNLDIILHDKSMSLRSKNINEGKDNPNTTPPRKIKNTLYKYERDIILAQALKAIKGYSCEMGCNMKDVSFKNKEGNYYVETHHIIPMSNQSNFEESLDVKNNLLVLCSRCHKKFHYGKKNEVLKMLEEIDINKRQFFSRNNLNLEKIKNIYKKNY